MVFLDVYVEEKDPNTNVKLVGIENIIVFERMF